MSKIVLDNITTGFASTGKINNNNDTVEDHLNNKVLYRNNPTGEPNQMENELDMNSNKITNLLSGVLNSDAVNYGQLVGAIATLSTGLIASQRESQTGADVSGGVSTLLTITYTVAGNNLFVFRNGVMQTLGVDYTETSTASVTWIATPNSGDALLFITNLSTTTSLINSQAISHSVLGTTYNLSQYLLGRNTLALITDGDATPAVPYYEMYKTANTSPTTITNFDTVSLTKKIWVMFGDSNTTIDFTASSLLGNAGVDWTPSQGDHMTCVWDGASWYCDISDNTA